MPYVKLDCGILDSSLWVEDPLVRVVFLTMLAMCDSEGLCPATAPGISRRANLPLDATRTALARLEAPDPDDRSRVSEGRRIIRAPGGYQVVNYLSYRDRDYGATERMRRYRERCRQRRSVTRNKRNVTSTVTQAEAEAEAEAEAQALSTEPSLPAPGSPDLSTDPPIPPPPPRRAKKPAPSGQSKDFEQFWQTYPRKVGKGAALRAWRSAKLNGTLPAILTALDWQQRSDDWTKDNGRYVPHPATYLNQRRWEDEPPAPPAWRACRRCGLECADMPRDPAAAVGHGRLCGACRHRESGESAGEGTREG